MAGVSDVVATLMLDWMTSTGTPTQPLAVFLALYTVNPTFTTGAGGTEATGGSYAREEVTFSAAAARAITNTSTHEFVVGTDLAADTYTGFGLYDAVTAGVYLGGATMAGGARTVVSAGDKISYAAGAIDITLPNA